MVSKHRHWLATWSVALGLLTAHCSSQLPSNLDNYHCSPAGRCLDGYTCSPERLCIRDDDDAAWVPPRPDASTEMSIQAAEEPSTMTPTQDADASTRATASDAGVRRVDGNTDAGPRMTRDASVSSSASGNANAGAAATDPRPAPAAAGTSAAPPAAGTSAAGTSAAPPAAGSGEPPPAATGAAGDAAEADPGAAPTAEAGASAPPVTAEQAGSGGLPEQDPGMCREQLIACGDACVSTAINPQHCSACGMRCHEDQSCHNGKCEKSRGEGLRPAELAQLLREHGATLSQFANYMGVSVDDVSRVEISESDLPNLGISLTVLQRIGVSRADLARVGVKVTGR
jgi:DNA-binding transcriptional regulator YiaG